MSSEEKFEAARQLGVADGDVLRIKHVGDKKYVFLNTGVIKCLEDDGGWVEVEDVPTEKELKEQQKAEDKEEKADEKAADDAEKEAEKAKPEAGKPAAQKAK